MLQSIAQRKLLFLLCVGIQFSGKGAENPDEKERYGSGCEMNEIEAGMLSFYIFFRCWT